MDDTNYNKKFADFLTEMIEEIPQFMKGVIESYIE